jgi:hypothetical protein
MKALLSHIKEVGIGRGEVGQSINSIAADFLKYGRGECRAIVESLPMTSMLIIGTKREHGTKR